MEFIDDLKGIGPLRENENSKVLRNVFELTAKRI
jgi:hypothetical protein